MITTACQQYKKYGYCIAKDILPGYLLEKTMYEMDIILVNQIRRWDRNANAYPSIESLHAHMHTLYHYDQKVYIQSLKCWSKLFSLLELVMHENIKKITKDFGINLPIFQTSPVLHVMSNQLKIQGGYHGVGVHQDWPSLQSGLDTITIWFPFMKVDKNNFPVELVPMSHRNGIYPGKTAEHIYEIEEQVYEKEKFESVEVDVGDVLFFSNFTLHRSSLNGDDRVRIACSARYENACEKTFIKRAYPSVQKRIINRDLIEPNFPTKADLDDVFS